MTRRKLLTFAIVYFVLYILIGTLGWAVFSTHYYLQKSGPLQKYVHKNEKALAEHIFNNAFADAKTCISLKIPHAKKVCQNSVSRYMAMHIQEEEFVSGNNIDWGTWPHDLVFVKEEGDTFVKLGWDGKVEDITDASRVAPGTKWMHGPMQYLMRNCSYFSIYNNWSCELVGEMDLSDGKGYLVLALATAEDRTMPMAWYGLPLVGFLRGDPVAVFKSIGLGMSLYSFAVVLVPLAIAVYFYWHPRNLRGNKKKK